VPLSNAADDLAEILGIRREPIDVGADAGRLSVTALIEHDGADARRIESLDGGLVSPAMLGKAMNNDENGPRGIGDVHVTGERRSKKIAQVSFLVRRSGASR
jgi:hypothetical protein